MEEFIMEYRKGPGGELISALGYGCMRFSRKGTSIDLDKAEAELRAAIEGGVNYLDTAYIYTGSEAALGKILSRTGLRNRVSIATKLPQYLIKSISGADRLFEEQRSRLQTDCIDYYLLHMLTDTASWDKLVRLGIKEWIAEKTGCQEIESVHRLDMDTYGVMLFAKNSTAGSDIRRQFEEHSVRKVYRAILSPTGKGNINKGESGFISLPLSPDYDERPRQKADLHQGKEALTEYHVDDILADGSIRVTYFPLTGRTHQLRVHSAHHLGMGHAIKGDLLYGGAEAQHLCLHAVEIEFTLPSSGQRVTFSDKV
jgi:16S rRNA U516 pseudouridylate synthase RsuA-like enzyme